MSATLALAPTLQPTKATRRAVRASTPPTPYLDLDVPAAVTRYRRIGAALPGTAVHFAVHANPEPALLSALAAAGCRFDVASSAEVVAALEAGAAPSDLVYSHPVKRRRDIAFAARLGVRLFVVDSKEETRKVAAAAPGSSVLCRIATSGEGSEWSLSRRYGCSVDRAVHVLQSAAAAGLDAAGVSFHVGSRQRDPAAWEAPVAASARVFEELRAGGLVPWLLGLGGGLPARLEVDTPPLASYGAAIETSLRRHFGPDRPRTLVAPGRAVVAGAGTLVSTVVAVVRRGETRWVFLDAGAPAGLDETLRYRLRSSADVDATGPCVLAGPACDDLDDLDDHEPVLLPLSLAAGDTVRLPCTGAHACRHSTVGFNGFVPPAPRLAGRG